VRLSREEATRIKTAICDAVWQGEIDGETTKEVANRFGCSEQFALKTLLSIVEGNSGDSRFILNDEHYPILSTGKMFVNGVPDGYDGKHPFKYYWIQT